MAPVPSILLAIPGGYPPLSVPGHYTQLLRDAPLALTLTSLQNAPTAPELIVLSADVLFKSGLGVLSALKKAVSQCGATLLLVSELGEMTTWVAQATGAHAAVLGAPQEEQFASLAQLLLSERAAAATLRKEAAPQPSQHSGYLLVPA